MEPHKLLILYAIVTGVCTSYINGSLSNWNASSPNIAYNNTELLPPSNWNSSQNNEIQDTKSQPMAVFLKITCIVTGALVGGQIADTYSPRIASITSTFLTFTGALVIILSTNQVVYYTGLSFLDFGTCCSRVAATLWLGETSNPEDRGKIVSLTGDGFHIGFFFSYVVQIVVTISKVSYLNSWQIIVGASCIFPIMQMLIIYNIPETQNIQSKKDQGSKRSIFCKILTGLRCGPYRMALLANMSLSIIQQLLGVDSVIFNEPKIPYKKESDLGLLIFLQLLGSTINLFLVDRLPRKKLIFTALSLLGLVLSALAAVFHFELAKGPLIVVVVSCYLMVFSAAFGEIPQIVLSESFPNYFKAPGVAISSIASSTSNVFTSAAFLTLEDKFGTGITFLFFAGGALICMGIAFICLPETKGLTMEQINKKYSNEKDEIISVN